MDSALPCPLYKLQHHCP
ncbi:hypothetical protein FQN60_007785 [Etheostoma spectabile]|uniref:Uncharacterized protein n=1 Tax=Etheostoma spectabile TaxID=54343 RepID=A0A5J5D095_9PERO|nr:hypothetical protein FQN60_007785 [Etheostoma spectabile]